MVPANALQRTFRIRYGESSGTCFTVDVDARQYIVTARHVVTGIAGNAQVRLWHDASWKALPCEVVGVGSGNVDIAVLAPSRAISPSLSLPATTDGMFLSQDAFFLGFPFGLHAEVGELNANFPIPLVKKACVSMMSLHRDGEKFMLLDGHNNPGFSGGPVIYAIHGDPRNVRVAGVVSGYRFEWDKVYVGENETDFSFKYNTGIVIAYSILHAVDLIHANPIGATVGGANA
jgi:S1-C subfamily serine protease